LIDIYDDIGNEEGRTQGLPELGTRKIIMDKKDEFEYS